MKPHWAIPYLLFLLTLSINWYLWQENKSDKRFVSVDTAFVKVNYKINQIECRQDSLNAQTVVLGKSIVYLDSCQQARTSKTDRAERRGKFIGGLLKGLFPNL
jgi:hypothetical protein